MLVFVRVIDGKQHFYLFGDYYLPEAAIEGAEKNANAYRKWVIEGFLQQHDGAEIDFDLIEEDMLGWWPSMGRRRLSSTRGAPPSWSSD
jgi:phage terminase large subunit-like protein